MAAACWPRRRQAAVFAPCGLAVNIDPDTGERIPYSCSLIFQPDGTLVAQTGDRIGFGPNGNFNGGNGSNDREYELLGILPEARTLQLQRIRQPEDLRCVRAVRRGQVRAYEFAAATQPAFFQGGTIDGDREHPRFDNPFLTDAARTAINDTRVAAGLDPLAGSDQFTPLQESVGPRRARRRRQARDHALRAGRRRQDDRNWNYDVSVNWGRFKEDTRVTRQPRTCNASRSRWMRRRARTASCAARRSIRRLLLATRPISSAKMARHLPRSVSRMTSRSASR